MASFISRMNLAKAQRINSFKIMNSKINISLANKLEQLGIIRGFKVDDDKLSVYIKYVNKRVPFVRMYMIAKSSRHAYITLTRLSTLVDKNGSSIFILSTGRGFLSHTECFASRCSGEIVIRIDL
jgi:ribosomal protein S8